MKILSQLSLGAVAAGVFAAPSAATTTTVNFNFANDASGARDITLGGNATPQFTFASTYEVADGDLGFNLSSLTTLDGSYIEYTKDSPVFYGTGPVALPAPENATKSGTVITGTTLGDFGNRYLPLKFNINGATNVGNAFYNGNSDLVKIEYAAVGGVPEPAIWAELVAGFALAGAAMRRRRPQAAFAA